MVTSRQSYDASRDHAEYIFGDSITSLTQDGGGVDVLKGFAAANGCDGKCDDEVRAAMGDKAASPEPVDTFHLTPLPRNTPTATISEFNYRAIRSRVAAGPVETSLF